MLASDFVQDNCCAPGQLVNFSNTKALSKMCVYYSFCLKLCGTDMGWHGNITDLYAFSDVLISISLDELRDQIIELNESDCLPDYEVWYHKLSDQIIVLNKKNINRQRYLARVLTEFYSVE